MRTLQKLICLIGILCFCLGGSSMDSKNLLIPAALTIGGGLLALATYHAYEL